MPTKLLPYSDTGYFSKLMCDYLTEKEATRSFYYRFPNLDNFKEQLVEKGVSFSDSSRAVLVRQLNAQYQGVAISKATQKNIDALGRKDSFTITTGHQLNLFTGPLYFLYKIFSVINLSEALNKAYPNNHFVPVFWMATEDHDFEEINYFNFNGKKIAWERTSGGAVGDLSTEGLDSVFEVVEKELGGSVNAGRLKALFKEGYVAHDNLAAATRYIANELFKEYGLVILDGNDTHLKQAFIPYAEKELFENLGHTQVTKTTQKLVAAGYGEQVHPREINLFYLAEGVRKRVIEKEGNFYVNETDLVFSSEEIKQELHGYPDRFSPNALLRPLYQEVILPNLCYVGGGGELAYWFQLKDYFESVTIPFPMLLLRNSVLLVPSKLSEKLQKLETSIEELFQKQHELTTKFTHKISEIAIDFSEQRTHLQKQFEQLYEIAKQTDASFLGAVGAQEKKQLKGLDNLEKRLLRAQKRKLAHQLVRLTQLQDQLFPNESLQERTVNFSEFYLEYGDELLHTLKTELDPLANQFTTITL